MTIPQPAVTWHLRLRLPPRCDEAIVLVAQDGGSTIELVPSAAGPRLRCRIALEPPRNVIARRRADGRPVMAAMETGVMTLEAPLVAARGTVDVLVRMRPEVIALHCDGALMDEEWPFTDRRGIGEPRIVRSDLVERLTVADDVAAPSVSVADTARWLPDQRPMGPFWRPPGENASAGDTMLCANGDELHLFWLADRRWHGSKWGVGAHQFDHAVTTDLLTWRRLPCAASIEEPWMTVGTGSCVHDGKRFHLFWHNHGERFGAREGVFVSTSSDGERFGIEPGWNRQDVVQPGVWREDGRWRLLSGMRLYESGDLRDWRLADERFIDATDGISEECPCAFGDGYRDGSRQWLLTGRTGFWTWARGERPQQRHHDAPYDGLMVPMVAAWRGRLILAGWLHDDAATIGLPQVWGGTLMFRELMPRADGGFTMRWVPELVPDGAPWVEALATVTIAEGAHADVDLPDGPVHLRLRVQTTADLSLVLGGGADAIGGSEIRIEASRRRLLAARATNGVFSGQAAQPAFVGRDFALEGIDGLDQVRTIDVIVWPDRGGVVIDTQLDIGRTIACRHLGPWTGGARVAVRGGSARIAAEVRVLTR
ncbi:MAG: hypothetical protein H0W83_09490 [Planctomycetes bacterium]|nr:hypothetical protein [Planctomycetota bacterium]